MKHTLFGIALILLVSCASPSKTSIQGGESSLTSEHVEVRPSETRTTITVEEEQPVFIIRVIEEEAPEEIIP